MFSVQDVVLFRFTKRLQIPNNNNNNSNKNKYIMVPVIIGASGIVKRSLRKTLEAVSGTHTIDSLQKTAILGTSHIIRKVLQCET